MTAELIPSSTEVDVAAALMDFERSQAVLHTTDVYVVERGVVLLRDEESVQ